VFGVAAFEFLLNFGVSALPKTREILSDLNGAPGWREQMNEDRDLAIGYGGCFRHPKNFLQADGQDGDFAGIVI
jgi:hypothetical protein